MTRPISTLVLDEDYSDEGTDDFEDAAILSITELRAAAGVSDNSEDAELTALGEAIADMIGNYCKMRAPDGGRPSLKAQPLVETFLITADAVDSLVLAKFPIQDVLDITVDAVDVSDYTVVHGQGIVRRNNKGTWLGTVAVTYVGGHLPLPETVKLAAKSLVKSLRSVDPPTSRDASIRSISLEGEGSVSFQTESGSSIGTRRLIPVHVEALLAPYRNLIA